MRRTIREPVGSDEYSAECILAFYGDSIGSSLWHMALAKDRSGPFTDGSCLIPVAWELPNDAAVETGP